MAMAHGNGRGHGPWPGHDFVIVLSWLCFRHGFVMVLPWFCNLFHVLSVSLFCQLRQAGTIKSRTLRPP
jgi:hypothetical protein